MQAYERGTRVSPEVVNKLKSIAAEAGLGDLAMQLSSDEWQVRRVFDPKETIISRAKKKISQQTSKTTSENTIDFPSVKRKNRPHSDEREAYHRALDEILNSGDQGAISAVLQNLDTLPALSASAEEITGTIELPEKMNRTLGPLS